MAGHSPKASAGEHEGVVQPCTDTLAGSMKGPHTCNMTLSLLVGSTTSLVGCS